MAQRFLLPFAVAAGLLSARSAIVGTLAKDWLFNLLIAGLFVLIADAVQQVHRKREAESRKKRR